MSHRASCISSTGYKMASVTVCLFSGIMLMSTESIEAQNTTSRVATVEDNEKANSTCSLKPTNDDFMKQLGGVMAGNPKLVRYHIKFDSYGDDILQDSSDRIYQPTTWFRVRGREGENLLMLDENFEVLSLTLLRIGVVRMNLKIADQPAKCFGKLSPNARLRLLRNLLLNNLTVTSEVESHICNMRVQPTGSQAEFGYMCCRVDETGIMACADVRSDFWLTVLLTLILITKVLVLLYSPYFVPEMFYRRKYAESIYNCTYPLPKPITVVKTTQKAKFADNTIIPVKELEGFPKLKACLSNIDFDKVSPVKVKSMRFRVKARRLLPEDFVPVSIMNMAFDKLFRCTLKRNGGFRDCCNARLCMCSRCPHMTWYQCFRLFTKVLLLIILILPWVARVWFYYQYESDIVNDRWVAADRYGLTPTFLGSVVRYLTPIHGLFIFIYVIVTVDLITYGLLFKNIKRLCNIIIKESLENVYNGSHAEILEWGLRMLLRPCERLGILGVLLAPIYLVFVLPLAVIAVSFNIFPALNFSMNLVVRVFAHFSPVGAFRSCIRKEEEEVTRGLLSSVATIGYRLLIVLMSLISFWSLTLLLMEVSALLVEICIYTLMGIIVNAGTTMQFVSIVFILFLYAKDSFGTVQVTYLDYHKVIRDLLIARKFSDIQLTARQDEEVQENTAFKVISSEFPLVDIPDTFEFKEAALTVRLQGLLVFLDRVDTSFTPEKFFYSSVEMNYCNAPGSVCKQTIRAGYSFFKMVIFLSFVLVVVLAFGNVYTISSTNQLLATVAGAFVPFLFRYVFKRGGPGSLTVDTESVQFKNEIERIIANYEQSWPLIDMDLEELAPQQHISEVDLECPKDGEVSGAGAEMNNTTHTVDTTDCEIDMEGTTDHAIEKKEKSPDLVFFVGPEITDIVDDNAINLVPMNDSKVAV